MGELSIFDYGGAKTVVWDPEKAGEAKAAEARFNAMIGKGFSAIKVNPDKRAGDSIDKFDPTATRILMVPFLAGG